jgi:hypothetical protein
MIVPLPFQSARESGTGLGLLPFRVDQARSAAIAAISITAQGIILAPGIDHIKISLYRYFCDHPAAAF